LRALVVNQSHKMNLSLSNEAAIRFDSNFAAARQSGRLGPFFEDVGGGLFGCRPEDRDDLPNPAASMANPHYPANLIVHVCSQIG